jgi:hypothetical protein
MQAEMEGRAPRGHTSIIVDDFFTIAQTGFMKTMLAVTIAFMAVVGHAEDMYNLSEGNTLVYDYHNVMSYSVGNQNMTNITDGRMTVRVVGNVETNGQAYATLETTYENIFGVPPQKGMMRQDETGVYVAMEISGVLVEAAIVKYPLEVGQTWDYFDGEKGIRKITDIGPMKIGERSFDHCVKIERTFGDPEKDKNWTQSAYYVPGVGEVRMLSDRIMGPTHNVTTTTILTP